MRCKVGDLVILTARNLRNPKVAHLVGQIHKIDRASTVTPNHWRFESDIRSSIGQPVSWADTDCDPIRDQPGEDETLAWCPVPGQTVEVAA